MKRSRFVGGTKNTAWEMGGPMYEVTVGRGVRWGRDEAKSSGGLHADGQEQEGGVLYRSDDGFFRASPDASATSDQQRSKTESFLSTVSLLVHSFLSRAMLAAVATSVSQFVVAARSLEVAVANGRSDICPSRLAAPRAHSPRPGAVTDARQRRRPNRRQCQNQRPHQTQLTTTMARQVTSKTPSPFVAQQNIEALHRGYMPSLSTGPVLLTKPIPAGVLRNAQVVS